MPIMMQWKEHQLLGDQRMSNNENTFDVVDTKTGDVTLNHKN